MNSQDSVLISNSTWIIPLLPEKLPGKVRRKISENSFLIRPLVEGLPLSDGSLVQVFFAPHAEISENDYVSFQWDRPGERSFNRAREQEGDPKAIQVRSVSELEAKQLADEIRERIASELRQQLEQKKEELGRLREELHEQVEEVVEFRTKAIREQVEQKEIRLNAIQQNIDSQKEQLRLWQANLDAAKESLLSQEREIHRLQTSIEPYRFAVPIEIDAPEDNNRPLPLPDNLGQYWCELLENVGLFLPVNVSRSYLLSLISASYSGSLVLLNGPVGVGKTSIVKASASQLGGSSKVIPVRPAWLDPSDLLGFFDPLSETFRPSPFLSALKEAKAQADRFYLVCLDELNLARIENYGADLLASLEYSRSSNPGQAVIDEAGQGLLLYSHSIEKQLWEEARFLNEISTRSDQQNQRLNQIQHLLRDYRSTFYLSKNLVLLGTLNSDETTYDLSPKVIDRSYVITYPPANLDEIVQKERIPKIHSILSVSLLHQVLDSLEPNDAQSDEWRQIVRWNQQYLSTLGIPLGHRAHREYRVFQAASTFLGLSTQDCLGHFLFTKLLPRISFAKNEVTESLFSNWLREIKQNYESYDPGNILSQFDKQMQDKRRSNVRYWIKI